MMPSPERTFKHRNSYSSEVDHDVQSRCIPPNKNTLYKKSASTHSLEKYEKEGVPYHNRKVSLPGGRFVGGIVYDTDLKHHYDQIVVVPGNSKWSNSITYPQCTNSTHNSNARYSVPKPLPRRDSLRGRTKSVIHSRPTQNSFDTNNESACNYKNKAKSNIIPNKTELGLISYNRANSAPPASPRHACNPNRFTWWFGSSSSSNNAAKSLLTHKLNRYVNILKFENLYFILTIILYIYIYIYISYMLFFFMS